MSTTSTGGEGETFDHAFQRLRDEAKKYLTPELEVEYAFNVKSYIQTIERLYGLDHAIAVMDEVIRRIGQVEQVA